MPKLTVLLVVLTRCAAGSIPIDERSLSTEPAASDVGTDSGVAAVDGGAIDAGTSSACLAPRVDDASVAFKFNPGPREIRRGALYVVYSGMTSLVEPGFYQSSNIYLIKGDTREQRTDVYVFGAGYADPNSDVLALRKTMDAMRSGADDATDADAVIRTCLQLEPGAVNLHFITPHWHVDHINQAFLGALVARGYDVARLTIQTHTNDFTNAFCGAACRGAASMPPFSDVIKARASAIGRATDGCNSLATSFNTPDFGKWEVVATPGHTPGTLSLDNATLHLRIWGGGAGEGGQSACPAPPGFITSDIHNLVPSL